MSLEFSNQPDQPRQRSGRRIIAGKPTGQKPALKMKEVWAIRIRLQLARKTRELALFNLAIDSKLRGCDLVRLRVEDVAAAGEVKSRAAIIQKKTGRPVQFEITEQTRVAVATLIQKHGLSGADFLFPSRLAASPRFVHPPVRAAGSRLGQIHRPQSGNLRHAFAAAHQGGAHLPQDRQPPRRAAAARSHQARKHCSLPRRRGR